MTIGRRRRIVPKDQRELPAQVKYRPSRESPFDLLPSVRITGVPSGRLSTACVVVAICLSDGVGKGFAMLATSGELGDPADQREFR